MTTPPHLTFSLSSYPSSPNLCLIMFLDRVAFFYSIEGLTYVQESQPCLETFAIPAGYHMFRHRPSAHTPVHSPHTAAVLQNHIFHTMIPPSLVLPRCQALCRLCLKPYRGHDSHIVVIVAPTQHFSTFRPSDSRKLSLYSRNPRHFRSRVLPDAS